MVEKSYKFSIPATIRGMEFTSEYKGYGNTVRLKLNAFGTIIVYPITFISEEDFARFNERVKMDDQVTVTMEGPHAIQPR